MPPSRFLNQLPYRPPGHRSGVSNASVRRTGSQRARLVAGMVRDCPHNNKSFRVAPLTQGSEHQVDLELEFGECVVKTTLPGIYGDIYYLHDGLVFQRSCTPYEYLVRLRLWDKLFGFAPHAVGMTDEDRFVSIQDFASGDPPSQLEVNDFLRQSGLIAVRENRWLWKKDDETRPVSIWVGDARADNFVLHEGNIIPIDLRLWITRR